MTSSPDVFRRNPLQTFRFIGSSAIALLMLAGCDENGEFSLPKPNANAVASTEGTTKSTKLVERDVEAPEVFSANDEGLWDGRPSLGGVWVAHPDVTDPERVIVRNEENGKFVIGALFRKERDLPGPKLQISSDAAAALGILAGAPAKLNVTALRREETEELIETPFEPVADGTTSEEIVTGVAAPAEVSATSLDPIAAAGAAIDAAPATPPAATASAAATAATSIAPAPLPAAPKPAATPTRSSLAKPFVQIGIFSMKANANRTAKQLSGAGIISTVKESQNNGKPFWRVVVGPATSASELNTLTKAIKAEGFSDAYTVSN